VKNPRKLPRFWRRTPASPQDIAEASYDFVVKEQQAVGKGLRVQAAGLENIIKSNRAVTAESGGPAFDLKKYYDASYLEAK